MINKFDEFVTKLSNIRAMRAIRSGLLYMMPLTLIGAIVLALLNLPIPAFQALAEAAFGSEWKTFVLWIYKGTLSIIGILALITVSYAYSNEFDIIKSGRVQSVNVVITALASYVAFAKEDDVILTLEQSGSASMLKALIIAIAATRLFILFCDLRDKIAPEKTLAYRGDSVLRTSFRVLLPSLLTIFFFSVIKAVLSEIHINALMGGLIGKWIEFIMAGTNLLSALLIIVITHILWFFGVHGGNAIMYSISDISALTPSVFTKEFFDIFVYLGGSGATLGLLLALIFLGRGHNENSFSKYSILPGIFNINEMLIYGLPVLFNPYYILPFVMTPVVLCIVTYIATISGLLPGITHSADWTTPVFISGYLSTGSIAGSIMQGVNLTISTMIYIPFIKLNERHQQQNRHKVFQQLVNEICYIKEDNVQRLKLITRNDSIGDMARSLGWELENELKGDKKTIYLEYQPKVNSQNEIIGAEALLRWIHPIYGYISPLVILAITDEIQMTSSLGAWIIEQAFTELKCWHDQGFHDLYLSVNLSPLQLKQDENLVVLIKGCIEKTGIDPKYMEIELTENAAIDTTNEIKNKLKQIRELGISISIDDFGMGHSSLLYLCDLYANVVKLDTSLIRSITTDITRQNIVKSILSLCKELNVNAVAEGVETKEQRDILQELGCLNYQGYYFSKSLNSDRFIDYLKEHE